jgi:anti-sigma B factor antagonist
MPLEITETTLGKTVLLTLKGTLVLGRDCDLLIEKVKSHLSAGQANILLDFAQVNYLDSSGVSALIQSRAAAVAQGASVKLLRLTKRVHDVLQITRLSSVFEIYSDLDKAVASFQPRPGGDSPSG